MSKHVKTIHKIIQCDVDGNPCHAESSNYNHNFEYYLDFFVIDLKIEKENPHDSDVCGQSFDKSSRLKEHVFTHTRVKPYECHLCDEKFSFTDTLARVCDFEATTKS